MIFLFCNTGYGAPFERAAITWARDHGTPITIVRSGRSIRHSRWPRRFLIHARWWLARHLSFFGGGARVREWTVPDINAPAFRAQIGPADHGIVAGFDQIFRGPLIARFGTLVNFHPSLLPLYRGPVPSHWCLVNSERASGYTLHRITEAVDAGEVLLQEVVPIEPGDDASVLDRRIATVAAVRLEEYLESLRTGTSVQTRQVDARAIYRNHVEYRSFPSRGG